MNMEAETPSTMRPLAETETDSTAGAARPVDVLRLILRLIASAGRT